MIKHKEKKNKQLTTIIKILIEIKNHNRNDNIN